MHRGTNGLWRCTMPELKMHLVAPPLVSVQRIAHRDEETHFAEASAPSGTSPRSWKSRAATMAFEIVAWLLYAVELLLCPRY